MFGAGLQVPWLSLLNGYLSTGEQSLFARVSSEKLPSRVSQSRFLQLGFNTVSHSVPALDEQYLITHRNTGLLQLFHLQLAN